MGRDQMSQQETWQGQGQRSGHEGHWGQNEEARWGQPDRQMTDQGQADVSSSGGSGRGQWQGYVVPYRYYGPGYAGTGYYAVYYQGQPGQDDTEMSGRRWSEGQQAEGARRGGFAGRGPQGYRRSDQRIEEEINDRLTDHDELDASDLQVKVRDGVATLTGTVDSRADKRLAGDIAERAPGVRDVMNQITVVDMGSSSGSDRSSQDRPMAGTRTTGQRQEPVAAGTGSAATGSSSQKNGA
ncbi:MAG TPA: BON domain-containing protein [Candidatus Limnocylindrales bacterium]|jgi:osmotically-inducible protein OsmY|nr:BON domain-containing protein [Candidatus Limnocylindrales bacterium]